MIMGRKQVIMFLLTLNILLKTTLWQQYILTQIRKLVLPESVELINPKSFINNNCLEEIKLMDKNGNFVSKNRFYTVYQNKALIQHDRLILMTRIS